MEWLTQFALIGAITILAVISPGPDFAITTRNSLTFGRGSGLATAAGIASGVSVHVFYTLLGLGYILAEAVWLLEVMRYIGAGYLIWLGAAAFRSKEVNKSAMPHDVSDTTISNWSAFRTGFICNALNPKTALFFIALFTQVVDPGTPAVVQAALGIFIAAAHLFWFSVVAILLTHSNFQTVIYRAKCTVEKAIGVCLIGLGAKLAFNP